MRLAAMMTGVVLTFACARDPLASRTHIKWKEQLAPDVIYGADEPNELHPKADIEEALLLQCVSQMWRDVRPSDEEEARKLKPFIGLLPAKLGRAIAETGSAFVYVRGRSTTFSTSTNEHFDFVCRTVSHYVFCKSSAHSCESKTAGNY
jgi:hypothetical protein